MSDSDLPTLLLVDDEPDLLFSLEGLLRQRFHLFTATSGHEALDIVKQQTIQVIVSDQRMPGMTGDELLAQVARISPSTVRILLTGYADIQDVIRALNTGGVFRYLTKPWNLDELLDVLSEAAATWTSRRNDEQARQEIISFVHDVTGFLGNLPPDEETASLLQRAESLAFLKKNAS